MTEDEKRRVKSDVIEAMRIAIEDSLSPTAHVPGNMAVAYKAAEAGFAAGIEALAGPPEPSEEEVVGVLDRLITADLQGPTHGVWDRAYRACVQDAKVNLQALYRSRRNG